MNDIETQVLRTIGEDVSSPDVFTDSDLGMAQIRDSVNDAVQELCAVSGSYVRTVHVPLLADQQWYRLTMRRDYMGYIIQCWDRDRHTKLSRTDPLTLSLQDPEWMETTGYPMQYMQVGLDYFGVYMRPSASGVVLELKCVCIPAVYSTTTDPVKLRDIFKHAAAHFAIGEFYASRGDANRAMEWHKRYLESANLMALDPKENERVLQLGGGNEPKAWQRWRR